MKNHIKNYIKIMGLAAVPFGTVQAKDYEIKVTQEHKPDAEHFRISIRETRKEPHVANIVWSHNAEYPNPIYANPLDFPRMYSEELRREEEILMERGALGELFRGDLEANVVEWMGSYFPRANFLGNEDEFLMKKKAEWNLNDTVCKNALLAFKAGKNGGEVVRERQTEMRSQPKESFDSRPMCKLPHDCSYACYKFPGHFGYFFLVKDPRHLFSNSGYIFLIYGLRVEILSVLSDVPTVFVSEVMGTRVTGYHATREILDPAIRKKLCEGLLPGGFFYYLSDTVRTFVRERTHANDVSVNDFLKSLPEWCFEIESGRLTGAWSKGKFADTGVSTYVFKGPSEIREYIRVFEDPKQRICRKISKYEGAFNKKLLEKLEKKQAKPQNEIKLEEEEKEDKKVENNEIKNEINEEPKKVEKKGKKKGKKQKKEKEEDEEIEKDPFEPKKEEDKKINPFALSLPMKYMGGDD